MDMCKVSSKTQCLRAGLALWLVLFGLGSLPPQAASQTEAPAAHTQTQLKTAAEADLLLLLNEAAFNKAAQNLVGLEFTLANGAILRINAIQAQLKDTAADIRLDVQAQSAPNAKAFNLQLTGVVTDAEVRDDALQVPFRLTEISLANGILTPLLRLWFGEWLAPERWNAALPPLTLPRELAEQIEIPAAQFEVKGALPMKVTTTAYQLPLKFSLAALCLLEGRLAVALHLQDTPPNQTEKAETTSPQEQLRTPRELRARLSKSLISQLLARLADARTDDIQLELQPARIRQEETGGPLAITNYTDLESGTARGDVRQILLERLDGNGIETRLQVQGVFDTKLRGREYGIPYRLAPRGIFSINDRPMPLQVTSASERIFLQATPGTALPLDLRFQFGLAGRELGFNRQVNLPAERLLKQLELPSFYLRKLPLPRKLAADKSGKLTIAEQRELNLQLSGVQIRAQSDAVEFTGDLTLNH